MQVPQLWAWVNRLQPQVLSWHQGWCKGSSWGSPRSRHNGEHGCAQLGWVKGLVSTVERSCVGAMPVVAGDYLQPMSPCGSLFPWLSQRQQTLPALGLRLSPQRGGQLLRL